MGLILGAIGVAFRCLRAFLVCLTGVSRRGADVAGLGLIGKGVVVGDFRPPMGRCSSEIASLWDFRCHRCPSIHLASLPLPFPFPRCITGGA
jgi:hypothetical protein